MAGKLVVKLFEPVETPSGLVHEAVFRAPGTRDWLALGNPYQGVTAGEAFSLTENIDTIRAYMERCIEAPLDPVSLGTCSLADGMLMQEKFLDFFLQARAKITALSSKS